MCSFGEQFGKHVVGMEWSKEIKICGGGWGVRLDVRSSCGDDIAFFCDCAEVDLILLDRMSAWFRAILAGKRSMV